MQNGLNNEAPSLISHEASTAIKGLLMILIVFGHIDMLSVNTNTGCARFYYFWLYSFHAHVFMILPFIYGYKRKRFDDPKYKKLQKNIDFQSIVGDIKHSIMKIYVPYFWFFILCAIAFVTIGGGSLSFKGLVFAFLMGNVPLYVEYIGMNFVWFLPTMLAVILYKSVWYNSRNNVRYSLLSVSVLFWLLCIFKVTKIENVGMYVPFALAQGLLYLPLGLLARKMVECQPQRLLPILLFILAFSLLLYFDSNIHVFRANIVVRFGMTVCMFLFLYAIGKLLSKSLLLKSIGMYSLQIYLIHDFFIKFLTIVLLHFVNHNFVIGVLVFILTFAISFVLSKIMVGIPFFNKLIFAGRTNYKYDN